ncbi:MAG TPA: YdeI/OmpD-associated family protein [Paludibacter sp.]|nr:YdeI/OmpD-associated family protein [Paludibacter sp.]
MNPAFFENQTEFRSWLEKNYKTSTEIIVGFYKVNSGKPSMIWSESVDQALCFGWIDSVRRSIDEESYCIRFTPRNPKSIWSDVNIKKVESLLSKGLMMPEGIELFRNRKENNSGLYSYENKPVKLPHEFRVLFESNKIAFEYFCKQSDSYKRTAYFWILTPKLEKTRKSRLEKLIILSEQQKRIF